MSKAMKIWFLSVILVLGNDITEADWDETIPLVSRSDVISLTDHNFDSRTGLDGGGGDWMINFYAPWCKACQVLAPTWEKVATELQGRVNFGAVDSSVQTRTVRRFGVQAFPTIIRLSGGKVYTYNGKRAEDQLVHYALSDVTEEEAAQEVPPSLTMLGFVASEFSAVFEQVRFMAARRPQPSIIIFASGFLFGMLLSVWLFSMMISRSQPTEYQQAVQKLEREAKKANTR